MGIMNIILVFVTGNLATEKNAVDCTWAVTFTLLVFNAAIV